MLNNLRLGVVIIGRNEGERLVRCLSSLVSQNSQLVYVDSGSTDDSVMVARNIGAQIVELNMSIPFTAARARNEGFKRLRELYPQAIYVQFLDGDCEVSASWLNNSMGYLDKHSDVVAVCGRRRERFPERSIYNMLCDIEWDTPIGETKACGGDFLIRADVFEQLNGFRANLIAGEEPELCFRLREAGWKIWRLNEEMTLHDAAITQFRPWWKRAERGGYAYTEGAFIHGATFEKFRVKESRRIWIWGILVPFVILFVTLYLGVCGLILWLIYPVQVCRIAFQGTRSRKENWLHAVFLVLGKFPETIGQLRFYYNNYTGKTARLIEYK